MKEVPSARQYFEDMLENIYVAIDLSENQTKATLLNDIRTRYALHRAIEIVGEASDKVPKYVQEQYPHFPWREANDMRNWLAYGYDKIDEHIILEVVASDFPPLIPQIEQMIIDCKEQNNDTEF